MHAFFQEKESGTLANPAKRKLILIPDINLAIDYTDNVITVDKGSGTLIIAPAVQDFPDEIIKRAQNILRYNEEMEKFYTPDLATKRHETREEIRTMLLHFLADELIKQLKETIRVQNELNKQELINNLHDEKK